MGKFNRANMQSTSFAYRLAGRRLQAENDQRPFPSKSSEHKAFGFPFGWVFLWWGQINYDWKEKPPSPQKRGRYVLSQMFFKVWIHTEGDNKNIQKQMKVGCVYFCFLFFLLWLGVPGESLRPWVCVAALGEAPVTIYPAHYPHQPPPRPLDLWRVLACDYRRPEEERRFNVELKTETRYGHFTLLFNNLYVFYSTCTRDIRFTRSICQKEISFFTFTILNSY